MARVEMATLYPVAQALVKKEGKSQEQAWKCALIRERKMLGSNDALEASGSLLSRLLAFNFTTSSVERLFLGIIVRQLN